MSLLGGLLAFVSFPWTIIGFPIGIWVLNVLHNPEIKSAFPEHRPKHTPTDSPWPRRIFWLVVALVVTPVLLLLLSILVAALSWRKLEAQATPMPQNIAVQLASGEMIASVSTGKLSLLGIRTHETPQAEWHTSKGKILEDLAIDSSFISISPGPNETSYEFLVQKDQLPPDATLLRWSATPNFSSSGSGSPLKAGQPVPSFTLIAGAIGNDVSQLDLHAYVALGDFSTVASCTVDAVLDNRYSHQAGSIDGTSWELTFAIPHHDTESTSVVLAHDIDNHEVRVVATDQEGLQIEATEMQQSSQHLTAHFEGLNLNNIVKFHAQIRAHQVVTFPDIQLRSEKAFHLVE